MAEDKKGGWRFPLGEADELESEEYEMDDSDDMEEESGSVNPLVTAAVFLGLVILAAIICGFLWKATHKNEEPKLPVSQENTMQQDEDLMEEVKEDTADDSDGEIEDGADTDAEGTGENPADAKMDVSGTEGAIDGSADILTEGEKSGPEDSEEEPVSGDETMEFDDVAEDVTAKDVINLRSKPSTLDSENIIGQLSNGEVIERIGMNTITGWSKLMYNGQVVYAVSNYLTTDLTYKTPVEPVNPNRVTTGDGRVIIFVDVDNYITPKEYVNLRIEPSTSAGDATVKCQVTSGTVVHRTGYSADSGWSRVEYNGEVLYVVSSMVNGVEVPQ